MSRYFHTTTGVSNAYRACLGKIGREKFIKQYQVKLIRPDGSTIFARCTDPHFLVQLPVDIKLLNDDDRRLRIAARKPKQNIVVKDSIDDTFDFSKYATHWGEITK